MQQKSHNFQKLFLLKLAVGIQLPSSQVSLEASRGVAASI